MDKLSEKALFEGLKEKKSIKDECFHKLFNYYSKKIYSYCLKSVGDVEDAEDIFQEVFIRFYKNASKYEYISVNYLLIKIARNLCLNHKRNNKKFDHNYNIEIIESENSEIISEEQLENLSKAIYKLDLKYREPLILKVYNKFTYSEIAKICDISEVAARSRVFRAKKQLKGILNPKNKV